MLFTSQNTSLITLGNNQCLKLLLGVCNTKKRGDLSISLVYPKPCLQVELIRINLRLLHPAVEVRSVDGYQVRYSQHEIIVKNVSFVSRKLQTKIYLSVLRIILHIKRN
jgi:hypothetical protein